MRVHELAKELNISTKEIIDTLSNEAKAYKPMSGLGENEISQIKKKYSSAKPSQAKPVQAKEAAPKAKAPAKVASSLDLPVNKVHTKEEIEKAEAAKANAAKISAEKAAEAAEKKPHNISQVYFPQNSSDRRNGQSGQRRPEGNRNDNGQGTSQNGYQNRNNNGQNGYQNRNNNGQGGSQNGYQNRNNNGQNGYQNRNNNGQNGYQNRNNDGQGGYQNRNNNGQGGYQNRNNDGQGGYQNRNGNGQGGYQNRNSNGQGGYQNRNNNGQGGYQNRNNDGQDGYQNRNNKGQGGYQNRNNNGQGGYQNRNSNGQGGYQNRNSNGQGGNQNGYQNRNNNGQGGYNRNGNGQGGYNRNNDGQGGYNRNNGQGGAFGGQRRNNDRRDVTPKEDFIVAKPDARKPDARKDNHKNDRRKDSDSRENMKFAKSGQFRKPEPKPVEKEEDTIKTLILPDTLTIKELADKMKVQPSAIVKKLFLQGQVVTINQEIEYDTAEEIALEFNCICEHEVKVDVIAELLKEDEEAEETMVSRPPVVCVMGHVDHGKTSLLDAIRETHVTAKESGGITQKIGAYQVDVNGNLITFLDTPGHEAFTAMRMRGALATDIAILVVAADDGVMPQTIEAINHAKAANVDIIVAVNKIDKPNANIEKVKQELTEYELIPEDWGGSTIFVPVSAHTKEGIDELLEMVLLTAEVHELKANPNRTARGIVIEAQLDKGRGPVASILVQKGTLHVGDNVAAGACYGKIRAMIDDQGRRVKTAGPSTPVEILGLNDVPNAGEIIVSTETDKEARSFAETFISEGRKKLLDDTKHKVSLDALFDQIKAGNVKELGIIIKADVQGSVEAIKQSLVKLSNEEVAVKIIHGGVGNINESDVVLASASNAIIIGFNVKPDNQARIVAEREKVDLRLYSVIYNAIEDVEAALKGMLEPIYEEQIIGHGEIRQIFKASGIGNIAGTLVTEGRITRDSTVRITRDKEQIFEGAIASLKHFKDEVKECKAGTECGLVFEGFSTIQEGDLIEAHIMVEVPR
ncbi:MAG: translation initiation factor IF-2 [Lachnospira sp.]|nr:translation initiation factor IF-2 [Lachnospira sp.]